MEGWLEARIDRADLNSALPRAETSCQAASIRANKASRVSRYRQQSSAWRSSG